MDRMREHTVFLTLHSPGTIFFEITGAGSIHSLYLYIEAVKR